MPEGEVPGYVAPRSVPRGCAEPTPRRGLGDRGDEARALENALHVPSLRHRRREGPQRKRREVGGGASDGAIRRRVTDDDAGRGLVLHQVWWRRVFSFVG